MRLALIQLGPALPPVEAQVEWMHALHPDDYHVEGSLTASSARRLLERLEGLAGGDEVLLQSLSMLRLDVGEAAALLRNLAERDVACITLDREGSVVRIDRDGPAGPLLRLLAELGDSQAASAAPRAPETARQLFRPEEVEDIRRLAKAGLSARRIGLIYRRSPDCIMAVLRNRPVASTPHSNTSLRSEGRRKETVAMGG